MKEKTINIMIQLLEYAKTHPIFVIDFDINAKNSDIEDYLKNSANTTDWSGKPLAKNEVDHIAQELIDSFKIKRHVESYSLNDYSYMTCRQTFIVQNITYDKIYNLVSGQNECLPKNYRFVGNIRLADLSN